MTKNKSIIYKLSLKFVLGVASIYFENFTVSIRSAIFIRNRRRCVRNELFTHVAFPKSVNCGKGFNCNGYSYVVPFSQGVSWISDSSLERFNFRHLLQVSSLLTFSTSIAVYLVSFTRINLSYGFGCTT